MEKTIASPETLPNWIMPWPTFTVRWPRTALLMVDCQNYCCNPVCGLGKMIAERFPEVAAYYLPRLQVVVPNAKLLLDTFRESQREVIYTRHGPWLPDGRDMTARRRRRDVESAETSGTPQLWQRGTYEHEIIADLKPLPNELVIDKNASSPFNGTGIDQLLHNMELETLVVAGAATDMCVETTARDAADRGYNVIVVEDATATFFAEHHRAALSALARVYTQVWNTERVVTELARRPS
jgi:biuret amidohydrolase